MSLTWLRQSAFLGLSFPMSKIWGGVVTYILQCLQTVVYILSPAHITALLPQVLQL